MGLAVEYAAPWVSTGGMMRRVRRNSWLGLAAPLVVGLARPVTATFSTAPKKNWLKVRPCDRFFRFSGWLMLLKMLAVACRKQPRLGAWVVMRLLTSLKAVA